jgi:hypothetical protein
MYEALFTREMSDGYTLFSEKKRMRVARVRKGDQAVTMYDELDGAAGVQGPRASIGYDIDLPREQVIDFAYRYDYADKRMHGPEDFTRYFNTYVRPFLLKHGSGPGPSSARFAVSLPQMGLAGLRGQTATVVVSKRYETFEGRRFALIEFTVPAFSYTSIDGERLTHWANGAAITNEGGGVTYYLAVRHRAAAGAGKTGARPMHFEQSEHAMDEEGHPLLDLKRFAAGKALIGKALAGETGRSTHQLAFGPDPVTQSNFDRSFFAAAMGLTAIGLSVAEGAPNQPGASAAAGNGGANASANGQAQGINAVSNGTINAGGQQVRLPSRPGSTPPAPSSPPPRPFLPLPGQENLPGAMQPPPAPPPRPVPPAPPPRYSLPIPGIDPGTPAPPPVTEPTPPPRRPGPPPVTEPPPPPRPPAPPPVTEPPPRVTPPAPPPPRVTPPAPPPAQVTPPPGNAGAPPPGMLQRLGDTIRNSRAGRLAGALANSKGGRILGGLSTGFNVYGAGAEVNRGLNFDPSRATNADYDALNNRYVTNGAGYFAWDMFGILTSAADPVNAIATMTRTAIRSGDDVMLSYLGAMDAERQRQSALQDELVMQKRRAQQLNRRAREANEAENQRVFDRISQLQREIERSKQYSQRQSDLLRQHIRNQNERRQAAVEEEEFEQPQLPDGPGYPTVSAEKRKEIAKRAREKKQRLALEAAFGEVSDWGEALGEDSAAWDAIRADGGGQDGEGGGIWTELDDIDFEADLLEQMLDGLTLADELREGKDNGLKKMRERHPELEDVFGDFIENNMFDFGGLDGRGLSGTVATDLSPYAEWLLGQDINRLNALARAAGYPNLASALNDWRNLTKKATDDKFRQWAWSPGAFSGTIGSWASEQQHELARAQVLLGDLLNDSRFIESTAGLTDLAISGTTLSTIFRDFGLEDGDVIEITIQQLGRVLFTQTLTLTNAGTAIETNMRRGVGVVNIKALNEGFASPNTAEITIDNVTDGDSVQQYSLRTGENATLRVQTGR